MDGRTMARLAARSLDRSFRPPSVRVRLHARRGGLAASEAAAEAEYALAQFRPFVRGHFPSAAERMAGH